EPDVRRRRLFVLPAESAGSVLLAWNAAEESDRGASGVESFAVVLSRREWARTRRARHGARGHRLPLECGGHAAAFAPVRTRAAAWPPHSGSGPDPAPEIGRARLNSSHANISY